MESLHYLAEWAKSRARHSDVIQLELKGQNEHSHISVIIGDEDDTVLPAFQGLVDHLVQPNMSLMTDSSLELVIQVVQNPRGGVREKALITLDCDMLNAKKNVTCTL